MNGDHLVLDADLQDLVPGFLNSRRRDLQTLDAALEGGDFERIARLGHNIKGVAGSYGFQRLSTFGTELQAAAIREDRGTLENLAQAMSAHLAQLKIEYV